MELVRKFLSPDADGSGSDYGYVSDEVKQSPFVFGLNAGVTKLTKFEWIPNGGKEGAEQEALDIVFNINGTDKNYRMFPVTKAFDKQNQEVTDPNAPEMKDARQDFGARITHILHAFVETEVLKAALSRPIKSFKEYCQICQSILPKDFSEVTLDIFLQYQWTISEGQNRSFLEIPRKMKYGPWLKTAIGGTWTEHRAENIQESTRKALWYSNEKGEEHAFVKNGWFMLSNFANQQRTEGTSSNDDAGSQAMNTGSQVAGSADAASTPNSGPAPAAAW